MLAGADKVAVALDCGLDEAIGLADALAGHATWAKVGMTLFYAAGPAIVSELKDRGLKVFLDLKLHDIPYQVRGAAEAASRTGADLLTIHALGGPAMVRAAREGLEAAADGRGERTRLIAVTVLTSMDEAALEAVGVHATAEAEASLLARMACGSGADGIVCSPREAARMRGELGGDAIIVTPGVRPRGSAAQDQSRVATPADAISAGSSLLVVGRPITQAADPVAAFDAVAREVAGAGRA
ncbi:MAG: orotidine-5'-phosphate decarboxylase [Atopobiaceae bacterium]|jgi:orotidine-5'-phosphate decarboxylase|nr:orotidine-5'-phosphate decarboxylase [Atopobiaceae bacterium]MCH4120127.1 orotidine-5'-phosphate decarboxylase [Atopobiaceae bacterium]MCI1317782.1 orotidine-5'-phosphate decarboxylase [Atopobiaceae bacterium]MCI1388357.1 orotidine-5'-phosphate decarboxylase [Atopobiaceae bacterium]MCI1431393.1 orotidine-5'-phosphate decarboxylase [Atopobiaceae bacterium]